MLRGYIQEPTENEKQRGEGNGEENEARGSKSLVKLDKEFVIRGLKERDRFDWSFLGQGCFFDWLLLILVYQSSIISAHHMSESSPLCDVRHTATPQW